MADRIRLNFILSLDSVPRPLELWRYETVKSIKTLLRRGLSCETDWTPQQVHYTIALYNRHYQELPDGESLANLVKDGIIWNEDDIYMIMTVDSGRIVDACDTFTRYLRKVCIGIRPTMVREDPNHNYMFSWLEKPPGPYDQLGPSDSPSSESLCHTAPISPQSVSTVLGQFTSPPGLASSSLEPYEPLLYTAPTGSG
jgi:hypothetical protein